MMLPTSERESARHGYLKEMATELVAEDDLASHITQVFPKWLDSEDTCKLDTLQKLHLLVSELKEGFAGAVQELARIQYGDSYLEERMESDRADCAQQTQQLKELLLGLKDELADVVVQLRKVTQRQTSLEQRVEALAREQRSCTPSQRQTPVARRALFAGVTVAPAPELSPRSSCSSTDALPSVSSEVTADSGVQSEEPGSLSSSSASQACDRSSKPFKQHQAALPYEAGESRSARATEKARTRHRHAAAGRSKERAQPAPLSCPSANGCGKPAAESRAFPPARTPARTPPGNGAPSPGNPGLAADAAGAALADAEADEDEDSLRDASILDFRSEDDASSMSSLEATAAPPSRAAATASRGNYGNYGVLGDGDGTDAESAGRPRFPSEVASRRRPRPRSGGLAGRLPRCGASEEDILARLESEHGCAQSRFARSLARSRTTENLSVCPAGEDRAAARAATPTRAGKSQRQQPARSDDGRFGLRDSLRKLFNKKSSTVRFADPPVSRPRSNTPSRALGMGNLLIEDFLDCGEPCSAV